MRIQLITRAAALVATTLTVALGAQARPVVYQLPEDAADFKPGPGAEVARAHCLACHSADYVSTQPRGPLFGRDFWRGVVSKMIKVHGAPIEPGEADVIVDYLANTYR